MLSSAKEAEPLVSEDQKLELHMRLGIALVEVGKSEYPGSLNIDAGIAELKKARELQSESNPEDNEVDKMIKTSEKIKALKQIHQARAIRNEELHKLKKLNSSLKKLRIVLKKKLEGAARNDVDLDELYAGIERTY